MVSFRLLSCVCALSFATAGCGGDDASPSAPPINTPAPAPTPPATPAAIVGIKATPVATFDTAWAMAFLTADRALVSERGDVAAQGPGQLWILDTDGTRAEVGGMPENTGIYHVVRSPDYATSKLVYISYFEPGGPDEPRRGRNAADLRFKPEGLTVLRARLDLDTPNPALASTQVIWRQEKIVPIGGFQTSGYMAFSPDGRYLFICAGARDEFEGIQSIDNALGKTVRIFPDGSIPSDNPFASTSGARADIWTLGHRNVYGIAFAPDGRQWQTEHGPQGGDEVNLITPGSNYGWPVASNGQNYGAASDDIPDHAPGDGYTAPAYTWYSSIAPAGMFFYEGSPFSSWQGDAIIGGLVSRSILRLTINGDTVSVAQEFPMNARIRYVALGLDGSIWAIEDFPTGPAGGGPGRILKIDPIFES